MYEEFLPLIMKKQITFKDFKIYSYRELSSWQAINDVITFIEQKQVEEECKRQEKQSAKNAHSHSFDK